MVIMGDSPLCSMISQVVVLWQYTVRFLKSCVFTFALKLEHHLARPEPRPMPLAPTALTASSRSGPGEWPSARAAPRAFNEPREAAAPEQDPPEA